MTPDLFTAEQFAECRDELPDGGRWTELIAGKVITLSSPEDAHGTAVLNLGKALADFAQQSAKEAQPVGYACFELGLIVQRNPDTVRSPAVSFFTAGPLFGESDKVVTETRPAAVIEIASSNDRRRDLAQRVTTFLEWGVELVWVLDTHGKQVHVFQKNRMPQVVSEHQSLFGGSVFSGFKTNVGDLFRPPSWWK